MARHVFLAFSNPTAGKEREFLDWQKNVHMPDGLGIPGYVGATFFKLSDPQMLPGQPDGIGAYMTIWEIESDDLAATRAAIEQALPGFTWSDAIAGDLTRTATYSQFYPRLAND